MGEGCSEERNVFDRRMKGGREQRGRERERDHMPSMLPGSLIV